jgi:outer membrane protein OmpA-like peptidoglycan-associated protein
MVITMNRQDLTRLRELQRDGRLSPEQERVLAQYDAQHPHEAAEWRSRSVTHARLAAALDARLDSVSLSPTASERIRARLRAKAGSTTPMRFFTISVALVFVALAIVVIGVIASFLARDPASNTIQGRLPTASASPDASANVIIVPSVVLSTETPVNYPLTEIALAAVEPTPTAEPSMPTPTDMSSEAFWITPTALASTAQLDFGTATPTPTLTPTWPVATQAATIPGLNDSAVPLPTTEPVMATRTAQVLLWQTASPFPGTQTALEELWLQPTSTWPAATQTAYAIAADFISQTAFAGISPTPTDMTPEEYQTMQPVLALTAQALATAVWLTPEPTWAPRTATVIAEITVLDIQIAFESGSSELTEAAKQTLRSTVIPLLQAQNVTLHLEGSDEWPGPPPGQVTGEAVQQRANERAMAVNSFLQQAGVNIDRLGSVNVRKPRFLHSTVESELAQDRVVRLTIQRWMQ